MLFPAWVRLLTPAYPIDTFKETAPPCVIGRCGPFELSFNGKLVESLNISTILSAGCELCAELILECSETACSGEVIYS